MTERRRGRRGSTSTSSVAPSLAAHGGALRLASADEVLGLAEAALRIATEVGFSECSEFVVRTLMSAGATVNGDRVLLPRSMVEHVIASAPKSVLLAGQDARHDLQVGGSFSYLGSGGAAPNIMDLATGTYRLSTLADLYDAARLCDALSNIQFFARSLVAGDIDAPLAFDLNTAYAAVRGTSKHVMVSASDPAHVTEIAKLCYQVAGSEAAFRARPFVSFNVNHMVPPLRFHAESADVMAAAIRHGFPVHANVFGQLGASSPAKLAGSVAQTLAEALAGVAFANAIDPSAPVIAGPRPMITDLRTGGFSGGSGEQAMATALCAQVLRHWDLPCSVIAGATDSKWPDAQAGYEKALNVTMAMHAGANLVTQACGMQAGLMGVSHAAYVIDNDMLGSVLRSGVRGQLTVGDDDIAGIAKVATGEGHFLGQDDTYARMRTDFLYPELADRRAIEAWEADGRPDLVMRANQRTQDILTGYRSTHFSPELDAQLREAFDIRLTVPSRNVSEEDDASSVVATP